MEPITLAVGETVTIALPNELLAMQAWLMNSTNSEMLAVGPATLAPESDMRYHVPGSFRHIWFEVKALATGDCAIEAHLHDMNGDGTAIPGSPIHETRTLDITVVGSMSQKVRPAGDEPIELDASTITKTAEPTNEAT